MSKLISRIQRTPKRTSALLAIIAAAVIIPTAALAWGPSRQTFTTAEPADFITFNSITDNPAHGDERNFMQVKEAGADSSTYSDDISLTPGKEYTVYMYYHNNAAENLNLTAKDSYAKAELPAVVKKGGANTIANGYIGASNATPTQVWDDINLKNNSNGDIAIRYVPGSAKIHSKGAVDGKTMADSIITTGAPIGYNALDGKVPGCNQFAGYVTFNFKADQPNFTFSKQVRLEGTTEWSENVTAQPGAKVEYQLRYQNTGTTEQNNVILKDKLPANMSYVKGSSYLKNANYPSAKNVSDNLVAASGINVGNYSPTGTAYLKFTAKVSDNKELFCEKATLTNIATVETNNGSTSDDAKVNVPAQKCKPPVKDIEVCELATKKVITIKETAFDAKKHSKDLNDCKEVPPVVPPATPEVPTTPEELPQTGATENIVAITGLGALIASISYYVASRRTLG